MRQAAKRGRENALSSEGVKCRQQLGHLVWTQERPGCLPAQGLSSDTPSVCCSHPGQAAGGRNQPLAWAPKRRDVWPQGEGKLCSQVSTPGEGSQAQRGPPCTPRAHTPWQLQQEGIRVGRAAKKIRLGVILVMFQPLAVSLDPVLEVGAARLGDLGGGTLQEAELLTAGRAEEAGVPGGGGGVLEQGKDAPRG